MNVAVCCSVLQCAAVCRNCDECLTLFLFMPKSLCIYVAVCCSVLQCLAVCCSVLQCAAIVTSVTELKPCDAAFIHAKVPLYIRCGVLQCVAVCCSVCCNFNECQ